LRTASAVEAGVSKTYFLKYVKDHGYWQAVRGVYVSPDVESADMGYILQMKCREAVLSHETALYYLGLLEKEPGQCTATVKQGYNPAKLTRRGLRIYTVKREWHELGITEILSPMGNPVRVYEAERDAVRYIPNPEQGGDAGSDHGAEDLCKKRKQQSSPSDGVRRIIWSGEVFDKISGNLSEIERAETFHRKKTVWKLAVIERRFRAVLLLHPVF